MMNRHLDYDDEYKEKNKNSADAKEYERLLWKIESSSSWTNEDEKAFQKVQEKYLRAQGAYSAKKLIEEYGEEKASIYANIGNGFIQAMFGDL